MSRTTDADACPELSLPAFQETNPHKGGKLSKAVNF